MQAVNVVSGVAGNRVAGSDRDSKKELKMRQEAIKTHVLARIHIQISLS